MKSIRRSREKRDKDRDSSKATTSPPPSAGAASGGHYGSAHHVLGNGVGVGVQNGSDFRVPGSTMPVSRGGQGKTPPRMVIRAIAAYRSRSPQELSFEAGDFFHVVSEREHTSEDWFDAANPLTGARGLVPASCFQVLGRTEKENANSGLLRGPSSASGLNGESLSPPTSYGSSFQSQKPQQHFQKGTRTSGGSSATHPSPSSGVFPQHRTMQASGVPETGKPRTKHQPLYGVVQYDFRAERADELDAKRGESIIVIAQSNHEWFVAKPIGRLGGPGLIPVSFVAISDTTSGEPLPAEKVRDMIESGMVPPVEEWKKMTAEYKQASIPLGRFEFSNPKTPMVPVPTPRPMSAHTGSDATPRPNNNSATLSYNSGSGVATASTASFGLPGNGSGRPPSGAQAKTFSPASSTNTFFVPQPSIAQQYQQQYQKQQQQQPSYGGHSHGSQQMYASTSSSIQSQQQPPHMLPAAYVSHRQDSQNLNGESSAPEYRNGSRDYDQNDDGDRGPMNAAEYYDKYGLVTSATVESFHSEEENFWFHLRVTFAQSGYSLILYRLYDDFLEFQYALMDEHPIEAGKALPEDAPPGAQPTRIIPKMPGPVQYVDEVVCAQRVDDLTVYLKGLCALPEYLRGHALFYEFLEPRPGDVTAVVPDENMWARWAATKAANRERDRELAHSAAGTRQRGLDEEVVEYLDKMQGVTDGMARTEIRGTSNNVALNGQNNKLAILPPLKTDSADGISHFTPGYSMSAPNHQQQQQHQHHRNRSNSNNYRPPSGHSASGGGAGIYSGSPVGPNGNSGARYSDNSQPMSAGSGINFISPFASSSSSSLPSQSQPASTAAEPPFVKIKIFHRNTDDLIAIRVPPRITRDALLEKVRERLGGDASHVRYRDEGNGPLSPGQSQGLLSLPGGARLIEMRDDAELDRWIKSAQRLVAYVD